MIIDIYPNEWKRKFAWLPKDIAYHNSHVLKKVWAQFYWEKWKPSKDCPHTMIRYVTIENPTQCKTKGLTNENHK